MSKSSAVISALMLAAALWAPGAQADIKAFNAAVRVGDYKTAAAEAESTWKTWDIGDPQTAVLAREFGFAALVAGRYDLARQFGEFLSQKGASLSTPDDLPAVSAVLLRAAEFKLQNGPAERQALRAALQARSGIPGADMTSVLSWEALTIGDWNAGDLENAQTDAAAAAEFMNRQPSLLPRQRAAEILRAASDFLSGRSRITKGRNSYYDAMADVHDAIVSDINSTSAGVTRDALYAKKWEAEAWALAIESFLDSSYSQIGSNISAALEARPLKQPQFAQQEEDPALASRPLCPGKFDGPKLAYPASKAFQGVVGAVIARMETDEKGEVTRTDVLAAVPIKSFSDQVVKTLNTWMFKPDKGVDTSTCRLSSRNRTFRVIFRIL